MPRESPYTIILSVEENRELEKLGKRYSSPYRDVIRARIILLAAKGLSYQLAVNGWHIAALRPQPKNELIS